MAGTYDMDEDRAQLLACFLYPEPAASRDLVGRAVHLTHGARAVLRIDPATPEGRISSADLVRLADLRNRLGAAAECAMAEGLLTQPKPDDDLWKPHPETFTLTQKGATLAMAVLATLRESGA